MKKGWRDVILVHQVAPRFGIRSRLVGVPQRLPSIATQSPPSALAVGALEPALACDDRMLPTPCPRRLPAAIHLPPDLDHMQVHRQFAEGHVGDGVPRVSFAGEVGVGPGVEGDPPVQPRNRGEGEGLI
jgi:hypothetical protein